MSFLSSILINLGLFLFLKKMMLLIRKKWQNKFLFKKKMKNTLLLPFHEAFVKIEFCLFKVYKKKPLFNVYLEKTHYKKFLQPVLSLCLIQIFIKAHSSPTTLGLA